MAEQTTEQPPELRSERLAGEPSWAPATNWVQPMGGAAVVRFPDPGLTAAFDVLEQRLDDALTQGPRELILDLASVERVSSATVAMLLWARRRSATRGADVVLRHPSRRCREVLGRTGLLRVATIEPAHRSSGFCRLRAVPWQR